MFICIMLPNNIVEFVENILEFDCDSIQIRTSWTWTRSKLYLLILKKVSASVKVNKLIYAR